MRVRANLGHSSIIASETARSAESSPGLAETAPDWRASTKTESLSQGLADLMRTVDEMGGTANLYIVSHFSKAQEERTVARFRQEREKEYSDIVAECQEALKHIEWESERREFNFEEVEELEGDVEKIKRWYADVKQLDFWETPAKDQVDKSISEVEESLAAFVQKTFEVTAGDSGEGEAQH